MELTLKEAELLLALAVGEAQKSGDTLHQHRQKELATNLALMLDRVVIELKSKK